MKTKALQVTKMVVRNDRKPTLVADLTCLAPAKPQSAVSVLIPLAITLGMDSTFLNTQCISLIPNL